MKAQNSSPDWLSPNFALLELSCCRCGEPVRLLPGSQSGVCINCGVIAFRQGRRGPGEPYCPAVSGF